MKRLAFALALLLPLSASAEDIERMSVVVNWTNLQNAIAAMISHSEKLQAENAALESRLETAMEWLKAAQQPK